MSGGQRLRRLDRQWNLFEIIISDPVTEQWSCRNKTSIHGRREKISGCKHFEMLLANLPSQTVHANIGRVGLSDEFPQSEIELVFPVRQ